MDIIFATGNSHKLQEAQQIIGNAYNLIMPCQIGIEGEIPENGDTLGANSMEKAMYLWDAKQKECFADDTGLEVDMLNGAPGVYTARYYSLPGDKSNWDNTQVFKDSTAANMQKLLMEMKAVEDAAVAAGKEKPARSARFRTVVTLIREGKVFQFEGVLNGKIALERSGSEGFGYDPVFIPDTFNCSLAQLSAEQKNAISHRGKAMRALANFLNNAE